MVQSWVKMGGSVLERNSAANCRHRPLDVENHVIGSEPERYLRHVAHRAVLLRMIIATLN